jgi:DNA-binding MarR family transcriptional regulator
MHRRSSGSKLASPPPGQGEVVEALLTASRALVGVAARSLAGVDADVTLAQFRTLMVLASRGPQRAVDVATELGVNPSTATRMCDRLVRKGLIRRSRRAGDRRAVRLTLTPAGRELVDEVTRRRREELSRLVAAIPPASYAELAATLWAISDAAGEPRESDWTVAWQAEPEESAAG